jgi:hypothetical protein
MHTEGERKSRPAAAQGPYCAASCSLAWAKAWAGAAAAPHALAALLGEEEAEGGDSGSAQRELEHVEEREREGEGDKRAPREFFDLSTIFQVHKYSTL